MATKRLCSIEGCGRPHEGRGLCQTHLARWRRHGDPAPDVPVQPKKWKGRFTECRVEGCDRSPSARGWCATHYSRWRRQGDVRADAPIKPKEWRGRVAECRVDGCSGKPKARGYCSAHYQMWMKHGDPEIKMKLAQWTGSCSVDGCGEPAKVRGWCLNHYRGYRRSGATPQEARLPTKGWRSGNCKVCDAGLADATGWRIINEERYDDIADAVGVSSASVQRHAVKCMGVIRGAGAGRGCSICQREDVEEIEEAAASSSVRSTAREFDVSPHAIYNHMTPEHQKKRARYELSRLAAVIGTSGH